MSTSLKGPFGMQRIYALNQGRIGDDPNLLFPGQELWLAALAAEPAATEPVAEPEHRGNGGGR